MSKWSDQDTKAEVTFIECCKSKPECFAVGYSDGSIRVWEQGHEEPKVTFQGHKSAVSVIRWDESGSRLASGSKDCDIIIWDVLGEAGLYRLCGHSNGITDICFLTGSTTLISSSKDTLVKVWDLATQHCLETVVSHRSEVTGLLYDRENEFLFTFGADQQIKVLKCNPENISKILSESSDIKVFEELESIDRSSKERVLAAKQHDGYICVLSSDRNFEIFRQNYKSTGKKASSSKKLLSSVVVHRFADKAVSFDLCQKWTVEKNNCLKAVLNFANNSIQEWTLPLTKQAEKEKVCAVEYVGHRSDVRSVSISSSGEILLTVSSEIGKLWNILSGACIRTLAIGNGLCSSFAPGDKQVLIGTKTGQVQLFDLVSGTCTMIIEAHDGAIWSMNMAPDAKGFITGSADKTVKFWEFKKDKAGQLAKIKHIKTLQLAEEILCVKYSPDMRLIAVSLLDMTVKVFFEDSLKLSLSLYGHKLPVTSMDISHDGTTIITVSSDKNIKIWSLQFGDCRKSIFAHQEAITFVSFLGSSALFITASKDKTIRYWDASKFIPLQKINGHHGEIWACSVSKAGNLFVTASGDKSVRIWERSEEMLFPEEEQEKEMEEMMDNSIIADNPHEKDGDEVLSATKATLSSLKYGERIVEVLEVANIETQKAHDRQVAMENGIELELMAPEPLLLAAGKDKTPAELVMWAIAKVPLAELEEALLTLPMTLIPSLLTYTIEWFKNRLDLVVAARVLNLLLKVHHNQIIANGALRVQLEALREIQTRQLAEIKHTIGFNIAAMKHFISNH